MMLTGIDVSHWDGVIDWATVKPNISFAVLKCTEGVTFKDDTYSRNKAGCEINGIPHGCYHFFRSNDNPIVQAELFYNTAADNNLRFWCVDVEANNGGDIKANLHAMLDRLEQLTGKVPWLYTAQSFWNGNIGAQPWASRCPLWVANYTTGSQPAMPNGWNSWKIWQYSDKGSIPGIPSAVDMNHFAGTEADLQAIFGNGEAVPPAPHIVRVIASVLNVRKTPNGVMVGYVPYDTRLAVIGQANDGSGRKWLQVGSGSWVASWYCQEVTI